MSLFVRLCPSSCRSRNIAMAFLRLSFWIAGIFFVIRLFNENFILSNDFSVLPFREIDDLAFQATVRTIITDFTSGDLFALLKVNDYGYGSLFWFISTLLAMPGYVVSNESIVILAPRMASLLSCVLAAYVFCQTTRRFTQNPSVTTITTTLFLCSPIIALVSLRFHNHAYILLLSSAAFYYSFDRRKKFRIISSILLGLSIGIKLSALLVMPVVLSNLFTSEFFDRKFSFRNALFWTGLYLLIASTAFLVAYNPLSLLRLLVLDSDFSEFSNMIAYAKSSSSCPVASSPLSLALLNISGGLNYYYFGLMTVPIVVLSLASLAKQLFAKLPLAETLSVCSSSLYFRRRLQLLLSLFLSLASVLAASAIVCTGPLYYATYIIPVAALFPLCIIAFADIKLVRWTKIFLSFLLVALLLQQWPRAFELSTRYSRYVATSDYDRRKRDANLLTNVLSTQLKTRSSITLLADYNISSAYSPFDVRIKRTNYFQDIHLFRDNYDIIALDSRILNRPGNTPSRESIALNQLYTGLTFNGLLYRKIIDTDTLTIFLRA
jgi:hypothetical protein